MNNIGKTTEPTFNQALGLVLSNIKASWRDDVSVIHVEETRVLAGSDNVGKRPDILILESTSPPLVIETSFSASDAERDAIDRLNLLTVQGNMPVRTAFAIKIDERYRSMNLTQIKSSLLDGDAIQYALFQSFSDETPRDISHRRWPLRGWLSGSVQDLVALLSIAVLPREVVEKIALEIAEMIDQAASGLALTIPQHHQANVAQLVHQRSPLAGLRTSMVLWLNALLIQHRLSMQGVSEASPLNFIEESPDPVAQSRVWRTLLGRNWFSIFEPAVEVLELTTNSDIASTSNSLRLLLQAVQQIEIARLGLYINLGAELFPLLSSDRKEAAAFYTQVGTAELLANLTIHRSDLSCDQWASEKLLKNHAIGDLACGTGTLLRAAYRRVLRFHEESGGTLETGAQLHKYAMEDGLVGTDISPVAAHLTAASLAAIGAGTPYGETRIGWVDVGGDDGVTGSLEYLHRDALDDLLGSLGGRSTGESQPRPPVAVLDNSLDWVLMNPPYSRTRGGQSTFDVAGLTTSERMTCQRRWG